MYPVGSSGAASVGAARPTRRPHGRFLRGAPIPAIVARAGPVGAFLRSSRPALGPRRLCLACRVRSGARAPPPLRGPRPRFAAVARPGPLRRLAPVFSLGRLCALSRSAGARCAASSLLPCPRFAAGFLFGRPCCPRARPWSARGHGGRLLAPCRGFGPGGSVAAPGSAAAPPFFSAGAALAARGCRRLLRFAVGAVCALGFSPRPSRPRRPAGAPGKREARSEGSAPAAWPAFLAALLRAPRRAARGPATASGAIDKPKIVNRALTSSCGRGIFGVRGSFRSFWGLLRGSPWTAISATWYLTRRRFFHALFAAPAALSYSIQGRQSAERNKTSVILLRSLGPKKNGPWCGPSEPLRCPLATFGGFGPVLTLNKIMVLCRSAGASTCLSTSSYIMRARLSRLFPSGRCAPPTAFGRQPLVCHGVD